MKVCMVCKEDFVPRSIGHKVCSDDCRSVRNNYLANKQAISNTIRLQASKEEQRKDMNYIARSSCTKDFLVISVFFTHSETSRIKQAQTKLMDGIMRKTSHYGVVKSIMNLKELAEITNRAYDRYKDNLSMNSKQRFEFLRSHFERVRDGKTAQIKYI